MDLTSILAAVRPENTLVLQPVTADRLHFVDEGIRVALETVVPVGGEEPDKMSFEEWEEKLDAILRECLFAIQMQVHVEQKRNRK